MPPWSFHKLPPKNSKSWAPMAFKTLHADHVPFPQHHFHRCWPGLHSWWSLHIPLLTFFSTSGREPFSLTKFCPFLKTQFKNHLPMNSLVTATRGLLPSTTSDAQADQVPYCIFLSSWSWKQTPCSTSLCSLQ